MKKLLLLLLLIPCVAFADLNANIYTATGTGKTFGADVYVVFTLIGFSGTVGNAVFSNANVSLPVHSAYQSGAGARVNSINYIVTGGTLVITEVK